MSILQQVIEEYGISETCILITARTDKRSGKVGPFLEERLKTASVSSGSDRFRAFENAQPAEEPQGVSGEAVVVSVDDWSKRLRGQYRTELKEAAGDDWEEVANNPAQLIAFADLLATNQIRESGRIPDTYTSETDCKGCGPVPIFRGCPPKVNGCPWCFNRLKGLPIPKGRTK